MSVAPNIWILLAIGEKNLGVAPCDLRYFHDHFVAEPMMDQWELPPHNLLGKSKKMRDFVSWMIQAPLVSEKAKNLIQGLCGNDVDFLRFHDLKGKPYYAMNVLRLEDVLDLDKCDASRDDDTGEIINIYTYSFKDNLPAELPPIFKDSTSKDEIFVTQEFAKMAIEHKLTGLALADPKVDQFKLIVNGIDPNIVEGIIT